MKNLQAEVETSIDALVEKLHRAVGEAAIEALQRQLMSAKKPRLKRGPASPHRSPEAVAALAEQLYAAICTQPGERMLVLKEAVGQRSEALAVPMRKLVEAGRVRKTGNNQHTRYFPVDGAPQSKRGTRQRRRLATG